MAAEALPITALGGPKLLVFLLQLGCLLVLAVLFGRLARRLGAPAIVGELLVGVLLGPSVLGHLPASVSGWLPQRDPGQLVPLEAVGQLGLLLLVGLTGMHTDFALMRRRGPTALRISAVGLTLALACGVTTGFLLPDALVPADRTTFALFIGVAMCVCAIPVLAKILLDMNMQHRNVGQLVLTVALIDDTVGWLLLLVVSALATAGTTSGSIAASVAFRVVAVIAVAIIGHRIVGAIGRRLAESGDTGARIATVTVLILLFSALTQALRLEAALGAFLCGLLISAAGLRPRLVEPLRGMVMSVLAPVFFAMAGLRMDLTLLVDPVVLVAGLAVLLVAIAAKFCGAYLGARLAEQVHWEALAIGAGVNARGVIEVIVATVGVQLGVLNTAGYTIIVLVAIVTSLMTPPLLRLAMNRLEQTNEEQLRLAEYTSP